MRDVIFKNTRTPQMAVFGPEHRVIKVGTLPSSMLRIDDPSVSRMHAVIERDGDTLSLIDLGSVGGTRVNSKKVRKQTLQHGDRVAFGDVEFEVILRIHIRGDEPRGDAARSLDDLMARLGVRNGIGNQAQETHDMDDEYEDALKGAQDKIAEVGEAASVLIKIVEDAKGKLPIADAVRVLREVVGPELKPLGELLRDMGRFVGTANTHHKAKLVKEIMEQHGLSEEAALCLVVDTQRSMSDTWQTLIRRDKTEKPQR